MSVTTNSRKSNVGFMFGLIGGLVMSVYLYLLYLGGVSYFLGTIAWLGTVIIIGIAVVAGLRQKKMNGGFLPFAEALKVVFTVFAVSFLIQTLFNYVLLNYIDTSFRDALSHATLEKTGDFMRRLGASETQIEEAMEGASKKNNYSLGNVFLGYGMICIVFFLISLLIAAIIKKKQPPFENSFNQ